MKISTATRDRLRALATDRESLEDVVVAALDVTEAEPFWAAAAPGAARETAQQRAARRAGEAEVDAWMDGLR